MAWFNSKVKVTFIDASTGETFMVTEMPPDDLPESFEIDTTLHLVDADWSVVDADPKMRSDYEKSKLLTLRLHRIEMMDPSKILFSLPSICDAIPEVNEQALVGNEFVLAKDDWRQFEFVSGDLSSVVDGEISKIRSIHESASDEVGWSEIHVRGNPKVPLSCAVTLDDIAAALSVLEPPVAVAYHEARTQIANGFAFRKPDITVYGLATSGTLQAIAFDEYSGSPSADMIDQLKKLAWKFELDLVDWCRCERVSPDDSRFDTLFRNDEA